MVREPVGGEPLLDQCRDLTHDSLIDFLLTCLPEAEPVTADMEAPLEFKGVAKRSPGSPVDKSLEH